MECQVSGAPTAQHAQDGNDRTGPVSVRDYESRPRGEPTARTQRMAATVQAPMPFEYSGLQQQRVETTHRQDPQDSGDGPGADAHVLQQRLRGGGGAARQRLPERRRRRGHQRRRQPCRRKSTASGAAANKAAAPQAPHCKMPVFKVHISDSRRLAAPGQLSPGVRLRSCF